MATLVLGAAGYGIGGPIGGFVGATIGGYIDNAYLFPALFPQDPIRGPRLDDRALQVASEGAPMKVVLGPNNRLAGIVMWMSPLRESKETSGGGKRGPKISSYSYSGDIAIHLHDGEAFVASRLVKVMADSEVIYDGATYRHCTEIEFYGGAQVAASPTILAAEGTAPAFIKTCYIVIKGLDYTFFGNRPPTIFAFLEQDNDLPLNTAIGMLLQRIEGVTTDDYDVSRVDGCLFGYQIVGPQTVESQLDPLRIGYSLGIQEGNDGKLIFFQKGNEIEIEVASDDLVPGQNRKLNFDNVSSPDVPSEVVVKYAAIENDLQAGSVPQRRASSAAVDNTLVLDLPIAFREGTARKIAKTQLWSAEVERQKVSGTLPPSYIGIAPGDALIVTTVNRDYRIFVLDLTITRDWRLEFSGVVTHPSLYAQKGPSSGLGSGQGDREGGTVTAAFMDIPAIVDAHCDSCYAYFAGGSDETWDGAQVWTSPNDVTYTRSVDVPAEAAIGTTDSILLWGSSLFWDTMNYVDVTMINGVPESASADEVLFGANRAAIETGTGEWEIIAFRQVDVLSPGKYRLSQLLRGQRGTEHLSASHTNIGKRIVLLGEDGTIVSKDLGPGMKGVSVYYKMPPVGEVLSSIEEELVVHTGSSMRPFAPGNAVGEFDIDSNYVMTWRRRGRRVTWPFAANGVPLSPDEIPEQYEIDIYNGGVEGTVIRTVVVSSPTYTYTADDQTADGFAPESDPLYFQIYQISHSYGRGQPATVRFSP